MLNHRRGAVLLVVFVLAVLACQQSAPTVSAPWSAVGHETPLLTTSTLPVTYLPSSGRTVDEVATTPTPDPPRILPTPRSDLELYTVQSGDTLGEIARHYGISLEALIHANNLTNPDYLEVGQVLNVPAPQPGDEGPDFKILPDSELVYSPACALFDVEGFVRSQGGYLLTYHEKVIDLNGQTYSGAEIVKMIAQEYSVNPRLLLAVLEYQSGWVTQPAPSRPEDIDYPIAVLESWRKGLYRQLAWAANNLNRGYYLWRINGIATWSLLDGSVVGIDPTLNAGTAGVQHFFSQVKGRVDWEIAVSEQGLFAVYTSFFGYPFDLAIEPLLPNGLRQPRMQLPFESGVIWAFTGGPHGGWGDGSAWAALDFAPPDETLGCGASDLWVTAVADGTILRTGVGEVVEELDDDGLEQTGWTVLYMHIESRDRVQPGTILKAGERIGHPSCEGGSSSATHTHIARRYNGEWIPADQTLPFVLDGWASRGTGIEYDGFLEREDQTIEAWNGSTPNNWIQR